MDNPYLVTAGAIVCALFLASLAVFCLYMSRQPRGGKPARVIQEGLTGIRQTYAARLRRHERPPALVYADFSHHTVRDKTGSTCSDDFCKDPRELLLDWIGEPGVEQLAEADAESLLGLGEMSEEQFQKNCRRFFAALEEDARERGRTPPQVHFGYYQGRSRDINFDEAVCRAIQASRCAAADNAGYCAYDYGRVRLLERREKLEETIANSIWENRFLLEFQPFVELDTGKVIGGEVLSRLVGEEQGMVMPESFLRAVRSTGIHSRFDCYVFEKACAWLSGLEHRKEIRYLSCNFSRLTLSEETFAEYVRKTADRYGISHQVLAVEVTEERPAPSQETLRRNLQQLHRDGFTVFLDDFGAGITSLADLRDLPVDVVKIDKGLLDKAWTSQGRPRFLNVVRLAEGQGALVLCEGIENERQAAYARLAGCGLAQGYYYSRPVSATEFRRLLPDAEGAGTEQRKEWA